jgi:sulfur carrier protein
MKVLLRNPRRELELAGPMSVTRLLQQLELNRESVLVIRDGTLVPGDAQLEDADSIEIRPVISGGQTAQTAENDAVPFLLELPTSQVGNSNNFGGGWAP